MANLRPDGQDVQTKYKGAHAFPSTRSAGLSQYCTAQKGQKGQTLMGVVGGSVWERCGQPGVFHGYWQLDTIASRQGMLHVAGTISCQPTCAIISRAG